MFFNTLLTFPVYSAIMIYFALCAMDLRACKTKTVKLAKWNVNVWLFLERNNMVLCVVFVLSFVRFTAMHIGLHIYMFRMRREHFRSTRRVVARCQPTHTDSELAILFELIFHAFECVATAHPYFISYSWGWQREQSEAHTLLQHGFTLP